VRGTAATYTIVAGPEQRVYTVPPCDVVTVLRAATGGGAAVVAVRGGFGVAVTVGIVKTDPRVVGVVGATVGRVVDVDVGRVDTVLGFVVVVDDGVVVA
jgi:hypothetical protein